MAQITFHVDLHEEDDGSWWAQVKELPGCFASGFSLDELKEALAEAMQMWLPDGIDLGNLKWGPVEEVHPETKKAPRQKSGRAPKRRMLVCG